MKRYIDATIDCVSKVILSARDNEHILVHFLNGLLQPITPIRSVTILNPYNEKAFLTDKLSIVDIKAEDERMVYNWVQIYKAQIGDGQSFNELKPVISIWLLTGNMFKDDVSHHYFQIWDMLNKQLLP